MHNDIFNALEAGFKMIAKRHLSEKEYEEMIYNIRRTKLVRVGPDHKTVHDVLFEHAAHIADWATNGGYSKFDDEVEEKKKKALHNIEILVFGHLPQKVKDHLPQKAKGHSQY